MVYTPHTVVKPDVLLAGYHAVLEDELVLPTLVQHQSLDQFKGSLNDTVSIRVPGRLPARDYAFRNDRSAPIVFDTYSENKVSLTLSGHAYSAIEITDEQVDFDLTSPQSLVPVQGRAVAAKLNHAIADAITGASYAAVIGGAQYNIRRAFLEARRVLNAFLVPDESRVAVVGSNFETAMLDDDKLVNASVVGDAQAASALHGATLGTVLGIRVVRDNTIDPDTAYVILPSAFVIATAVPGLPGDITGTTQSYNGFAMRWLRQYDISFVRDRSLLDTYYGVRAVKDLVGFWDKTKDPKREAVDTKEYFLRGVKITLGGTSTQVDATLAAETNVGTIWDGSAADNDGDGVPNGTDPAPDNPAVSA